MGGLLRLGQRRVGTLRWDVVAGAAGVLVLLGVLLVLIVFLPQLALDPRGLSRNEWLSQVQSLRTTILQGLGGLALLGTLYFSARTLQLNRRGQLTERFTKAVEQLGQLGPEKLAVRLGGIYALEQIALDSQELHWPAMEVLTAFLRDVSTARSEASDHSALPPLASDRQAAATVLGRRPERRRRDEERDDRELDLSDVQLANVKLSIGSAKGGFHLIPEPPWVLWRLGRLDLRGSGCLALTMVEEAVEPPELLPLRGVRRRRRESGDAGPGIRAEAGHLTPEPSRWRCMTAGHVRQPGPPSAPTTGARTRPGAGGRWRRGADAGSTSPPTRRWPARPARGSARARAGG